MTRPPQSEHPGAWPQPDSRAAAGAPEPVLGARGLRVGHLAGVPVYLGRTWPVIAVIIVATFGPSVAQSRPDLGWLAYGVAVAFTLLLLISVLAHEAAHAIVGQWRGYHVSRIVADLWGGHTAYDSSDSTPTSSALVSVAGPVANAALAGLGWLLLPSLTGDISHLLGVAFVWTNGFVALFNLVPALPLDGGFLLEALVWKVTGSRDKGMIVAGWAGRVLTALVVLWAIVLPFARGQQPSFFNIIWGGFIGAFLWAGATSAIRTGHARQQLERIPIHSVWRPAASLTLGASAAQARALAERSRQGAVLVLVDSAGRPIGVLDLQALQAIPASRLDQTPATAVLHQQPLGWVVDAGAESPITPVITAMQEIGAGTIAVRGPGGRIDGVVLASDL